MRSLYALSQYAFACGTIRSRFTPRLFISISTRPGQSRSANFVLPSILIRCSKVAPASNGPAWPNAWKRRVRKVCASLFSSPFSSLGERDELGEACLVHSYSG